MKREVAAEIASRRREFPQTSPKIGRSSSVGRAGSMAAVSYTHLLANGAGTGAATPFDWKNNAAQVETAINQISEIADSRVVVAGTTALVAVRYTDAYQGETTERIREMVAGAVREADPTIQTVAVTSEEMCIRDRPSGRGCWPRRPTGNCGGRCG